ncbi:hypothetical protein [Kitasatospora sp. NPDC004272]
MTEPQHTVHTAPVTGSGRTPALLALVAAAQARGSEVWLADPAERHHDLADHVDRHAAGADATVALLKDADALIRERQDAARDGQPDGPVVRVLLDGLPAVLQRPGVAELIEQILRTGRKNGVLESALEEADGSTFRGHPALRELFTQPRTAAF